LICFFGLSVYWQCDPLSALKSTAKSYPAVAAGCLVVRSCTRIESCLLNIHQIFDCLLTLDLEIKFIWMSKFNITKAMYFINWYTTILDVVLICIREPPCMPSKFPVLKRHKVQPSPTSHIVKVSWKQRVVCSRIISYRKTGLNLLAETVLYILGLYFAECRFLSF
jgi:hypothetical protein